LRVNTSLVPGLAIQRNPAPPASKTIDHSKLKIKTAIGAINYAEFISNKRTITVDYISDTYNLSSKWTLYDAKDGLVDTNSEMGGGKYDLTADIIKKHVESAGSTVFGEWTLRYEKDEYYDDLNFRVIESAMPAPELQDAKTSASLFNVRELPGENTRVLAKLPGVAIPVSVKDKAWVDSKNWYQIKLKQPLGSLAAGATGWVIDDGVVATVSWDFFLTQLRKFETQNAHISLSDRITKLRQMSHKKELDFDTVIGTGAGSEYLDTRPFIKDEWDILKDSQIVRMPDGLKVDVYHLLVGLDVLPRKVENKTYKGFALGQNYSAATWSGDIGAGAADACIGQDKDWEAANNIPALPDQNRGKFLDKINERYYTTRAPESDLLADVDAWGADRIRSKAGSSSTIESILQAYYTGINVTNTGVITNKRKDAVEAFLQNYGFHTQEPLIIQPAVSKMREQIFLFAKMWIRKKGVQATFSYNENVLMLVHVIPMTEMFLQWLDALSKANGVNIPKP
jgi:hypothetical protein